MRDVCRDNRWLGGESEVGSLSAETIEGAARALERIDDIEGRDGLTVTNKEKHKSVCSTMRGM